MPRIAVTMPTRNRANLIGRAIRSLGRQTFRDCELLVGDDGCTDGTPEAVEREAKAAGVAFRIIGGDGERVGQVSMRNRLIRESDSEFIAVLDDDDEALPDRLAIQVRMMESDPRMAVTGGAAFFRNDTTGHETLQPRPTADMDIRRFALGDCAFWHSTVMMARSHLPAKPYDETMKGAYDSLLWAQMTKREDVRFANTDKATTILHLHEQRMDDAAAEARDREFRKRLVELNAKFLKARGAPGDLEIGEWLLTANTKWLTATRWWKVEPGAIPEPGRLRSVYRGLDRWGRRIAGKTLAQAVELRTHGTGEQIPCGPASLTCRVLSLRGKRTARTIRKRCRRKAAAVWRRAASAIRRRRPPPEEGRAA